MSSPAAPRPMTDASALLRHLNEAQRAAVTHAGSPLLIVAGPGSGKTRLIAHRIAFRILAGAPPQRILAITFTNRAASELRTRVETLLGGPSDVRIGTFHWFGNLLLRRHAHRLGFRRDFLLLSPRDARSVLGALITERHWEWQPPVAEAAAVISVCKNGADLAEEARRRNLPVAALEALAGAYRARLRKLQAMDLDDLIWLAAELLEEHPDVRSSCRAALEEVLVDEYQDTNPVQQRLLAKLVPVKGSLIAVGDEDQAIYGWRQAGSGTVQRFRHDFSDSRIIALEETYRSTKHILRAATELMRRVPGRLERTLRTSMPAGDRPVCLIAEDEVDEANLIAGEILELVENRNVTWSDVAVLYRVNAQSRALEDALIRSGIPYGVLSGQRFYERPQIRTVTAYLRLALDVADDAATATLLERIPGIGPRRLARLREAAEMTGGTLASQLISDRATAPLPALVRVHLRELASRIDRVSAVRDRALGDVVASAIDAARVHLELSATPAEMQAAAEDLDELRSMLRELDQPNETLRSFVDRLTTGHGGEGANDQVNLMSLHASKGLEFPVVFIAGVEEGLLPHRRSQEDRAATEEERRLLYVGMTRAQRLLYCSYAHARLLGGHALVGTQSRFLTEMGRANMTVRVSKRSKARPRLQSVRPGERVYHPRWSSGTVEAVEGKGRETLVTITFDGAGRRRLQLCHAPLRRIQDRNQDAAAG